MNKKEVLIISVSIFLTIAAWVIIDLYHIQQRISDTIKIEPVQIPNYRMDKKLIDLLRERKE